MKKTHTHIHIYITMKMGCLMHRWTDWNSNSLRLEDFVWFWMWVLGQLMKISYHLIGWNRPSPFHIDDQGPHLISILFILFLICRAQSLTLLLKEKEFYSWFGVGKRHPMSAFSPQSRHRLTSVGFGWPKRRSRCPAWRPCSTAHGTTWVPSSGRRCSEMVTGKHQFHQPFGSIWNVDRYIYIYMI